MTTTYKELFPDDTGPHKENEITDRIRELEQSFGLLVSLTIRIDASVQHSFHQYDRYFGVFRK